MDTLEYITTDGDICDDCENGVILDSVCGECGWEV